MLVGVAWRVSGVASSVLVKVWAIGPAFGDEGEGGNPGYVVTAFVWGLGRGQMFLGTQADIPWGALTELFCTVKMLSKATAGSRN